MTVDEYETIRLIDLLGYTQEECACQMNVARTTIQSVYTRARRKLAETVVEGKQLRISGGEYRLCPQSAICRGKTCGRHCSSGYHACSTCSDDSC